MLKRTLLFTKPANIKLRYSQLVISYKEEPEDVITVPIEDIGVVIVENQQVTITIPLLNALSQSGVQVVFCDSKGMPASTLLSFEGNNTQGETLRNQIDCGEVLKKQLWKQIIERKIYNQSLLLDKVGKDGGILRQYYMNVKSGDKDNREGAASRLYFPLLFGKDFVRDRNSFGVNALLNYGYSVLRSTVARALVSSGLFPGIGIFHHNRSNAFPLADDIMEPFRPFVDEIVYCLYRKGEEMLSKDTKAELIKVLYADADYDKVTRPLSVGMTMTTASLAKCFSKTQSKLSLPKLP